MDAIITVRDTVTDTVVATEVPHDDSYMNDSIPSDSIPTNELTLRI